MDSTLLQQYMPEYKMKQVDRIRVKAAPNEAWRVVRALDTQSSPLSKFLFTLRSTPEKFFKKEPRATGSSIDDFTGPGKGFQILEEDPGREIVIGSVGKFWKPTIEWAAIDSKTFTAFSNPEFAKLAWNLRIDPDLHGGSWITWELRVESTDEETWRIFKRYWFFIGKFSHWLRRSAMRAFRRQLGGSPSEETLVLPYDDLILAPKYQKTMSATIEAPPEKVWPWLVQMGCQRAGWYSIDRLDNAGIPSARKIIPELQSIKVGQVLPWKPDGIEGFTVLAVCENKYLILGSSALAKGPHESSSLIDDTWAFILEPIGNNATRLITRVRADYTPSFRNTLLKLWLQPIHNIMEYAQLRNLKRRIKA